jgi:hypothetical protein
MNKRLVMIKTALLLITICATVFARAQQTVTFKCNDGVEYSFTGTLCCTEAAPTFTVRYYYAINADNSVSYYSTISVDNNITEFRTFKITPKLVTEVMDGESTSATEQDKKLFTLYVYEDPMGDASKTIIEKSVLMCNTTTDNGINRTFSGYTLFFESKELLDSFVEMYNRLKQN